MTYLKTPTIHCCSEYCACGIVINFNFKVNKNIMQLLHRYKCTYSANGRLSSAGIEAYTTCASHILYNSQPKDYGNFMSVIDQKASRRSM